MNVAFIMLFLTLSNVKVNPNNRELRLSFYTAAKAFFTTKQVELVRKKVFTITALNPEDEIIVVYIAFLAISNMNKVYLFYRAQMALLKVGKTFTTVSPEYSNYLDVFSPKLSEKLLKYTGTNNHIINLVNNK